MRICVDLTSLDDNFSGIERFALSITKQLIKHREHHWILVFKNKIHPDFQQEQLWIEKIIIKGSNKLIFNQVLLPARLIKIKADRYFFPAFPAPFFFFNKNVLNTIHDLSCWDCPASNKKYMIWYFKIMYKKASLSNKKIITVSNFSKGRICKILKVKPENIYVVYNGISNIFNKEKICAQCMKNVIRKYDLPQNYILCLSTLEPRKNLRLLLDACFDLYQNNIVEEIVLAGRKGWKMENFLKGYSEEFLSHVYFTGFIDDEDLPIVYKLAKVFIFPSLYEGFGIPPLEALSCGTPVISSDSSSLPEILGDSVTYFANNDKNALLNIIKSKSYINNKSSINIAKYQWDIEANKLLNYMEQKI